MANPARALADTFDEWRGRANKQTSLKSVVGVAQAGGFEDYRRAMRDLLEVGDWLEDLTKMNYSVAHFDADMTQWTAAVAGMNAAGWGVSGSSGPAPEHVIRAESINALRSLATIIDMAQDALPPQLVDELKRRAAIVRAALEDDASLPGYLRDRLQRLLDDFEAKLSGTPAKVDIVHAWEDISVTVDAAHAKSSKKKVWTDARKKWFADTTTQMAVAIGSGMALRAIGL